MPVLVSDSEVKAIFKTTVDTTPFISTAAVLTETYLGSAGLAQPLVREIQLYLAAHLACARDPRMLEQSADQMRVKFQRTSDGLGLDLTEYGQTVKLLDPTGNLSSTGLKRATIRVD